MENKDNKETYEKPELDMEETDEEIITTSICAGGTPGQGVDFGD